MRLILLTFSLLAMVTVAVSESSAQCICNDSILNSKSAEATRLQGACTVATNQANGIEASYNAALKKANKEKNKKKKQQKVAAVQKQFAKRRSSAATTRDQSCGTYNAALADFNSLRDTCSIFDDANLDAVAEDSTTKQTILNQLFSHFGGYNAGRYIAEKMITIKLSPSCNAYLADNDSKRGANTFDYVGIAMDKIANKLGYTAKSVYDYEAVGTPEDKLANFLEVGKGVVDSQLIPRFSYTLVANDFVCQPSTSTVASGIVFNYMAIFFNLFQSPYIFASNSGKIHATLVISPRVSQPLCKVNDAGDQYKFAISSTQEFKNPPAYDVFTTGILVGGAYRYGL